jgi:hypothetical protein
MTTSNLPLSQFRHYAREWAPRGISELTSGERERLERETNHIDPLTENELDAIRRM